MQVGDKVRLTKEFCEHEPHITGNRTGWRITHIVSRDSHSIRIVNKGQRFDVSAEEIEAQP